MQVYGKRWLDTVVDRQCDVCGNSVIIDVNGQKCEEFGELHAAWEYGSKADGTTYHLDLCEECFTFAIAALREYRRDLLIFDTDEDLPGEGFGIDRSQSIK